jgi:hypothetical protein
MEYRMARQAPEQEKLTPVEARQGFLDRPVLIVMMVSIAAVVVIFGLMLYVF